MTGDALYDRLGVGYAATRRADPRLAAAIGAALGDAVTVVNVGAGTGSYEPTDRKLVAIEPSRVMIAQRPLDAAPAIVARAEALPLADHSVDAAMAVLSDHHWDDRARGLREMRRVARKRAVVFQHDPACGERFWMVRDYLPTFRRRLRGHRLRDMMRPLGAGPRPTSTRRCAPGSRCSPCCHPPTWTRRSRDCAPICAAASGSGATPTSSTSRSWTSASGSSWRSTADRRGWRTTVRRAQRRGLESNHGAHEAARCGAKWAL